MRARVTSPATVKLLRISTAALSAPAIQSAPAQSAASRRPVEKPAVADAPPQLTVYVYEVSLASARPAGSGTNWVALLGLERAAPSAPSALTARVQLASPPRAPSGAASFQENVGEGSSIPSGSSM